MTSPPANNPLFSFVIPTFGYGRFLRQCIDACLEQPVEKEVVVIDGGSTDETVEILKSYGTQVSWVSEPDRGQSHALNKGVRMARGSVIGWINSDDFYAAGKPLEPVARAFANDPTLDIVFTEGTLVDEQGASYMDVKSTHPITARELLLRPGNSLFQPTIFFRRALFEAVGGVDESLHYAMDLDLWLKMLPRARRTEHIPRVVACGRIHRRAKTQVALRETVLEFWRVKRRYRCEMPLSPWEQTRFLYGRLKPIAWWLAVRARLHKPKP